MINYSADSRYLNTEFLNRNHTLFLKNREPLTFSREGAYYHTFSVSDTLEGLAYEYYNSEKLYWVILDANPKYMSELDIQVGDVIIIPKYSPQGV